MTEDEKEGIVTVYQETIKRFLILRLNIEVRDDGVCLQLPPPSTVTPSDSLQHNRRNPNSNVLSYHLQRVG